MECRPSIPATTAGGHLCSRPGRTFTPARTHGEFESRGGGPIVAEAEVVEAPGCDPGGSGFESHRSPQPSDAMNPRILYLGSQQSFDEHTARMLVRWLYATTGNRALWVNSGGRGLIVVHPKAEA